MLSIARVWNTFTKFNNVAAIIAHGVSNHTKKDSAILTGRGGSYTFRVGMFTLTHCNTK
jgi:hypothetical protein